METIPKRGQTDCLVNVVFFAETNEGEGSIQQAFSLPPLWNGLPIQSPPAS